MNSGKKPQTKAEKREERKAENAAKRFLALAEHLLSGGDGLRLFLDGIGSPAEHYRDGWYTPKGEIL